MFDITHLSVRYEDEMILKNLTLSIKKGEITTLIGPNGCGKSTLLKCLSRLLTLDSGSITLNHMDLQEYKLNDYAKKVSILPQVRDIPNTTVETLVSHGRFPHLGFMHKKTAFDEHLIKESMKLTGVYHKRHESLHNLSGGERQKVYLAMMLAQDTEIILLDEPTTFLDLNHQIEILELVKTLKKKNKTILMVLHDIGQALTYSDQLVVMNHGTVVFTGSKEEIIQSDTIKNVFGLSTKVFIHDDKTYYF
ncbi:MAG: ABC transporter ATP-binding protein, partial [Turicibacter sp.]